MNSITVFLNNEVGLHARPAALLVSEVSKYKSNIKIIKNGKEYNPKSILGVLSMGAKKGDEITIAAEGEDEDAAVCGIKSLIEGFVD